MPNMEGNELLTELHRRVPGLPIILVTRFGSISAAAAAMQAGAFDYVTNGKPHRAMRETIAKGWPEADRREAEGRAAP